MATWYGDGYASTTVSGADFTMRPRSSARRVEIVRRVDSESMLEKGPGAVYLARHGAPPKRPKTALPS